jgi:alkanesulfonate monooxygenase SsuD/methylene tetrahydromethanopterin reductase-like flavin-dependent oxidoreductase (luciferase family)
MADRYAAALDMAEWADRLGCGSISISEHHGSADGYMPSPIVMVAAMAARTRSVRFSIAALLAPFYDPVRVAEDLLVLDHLTKGRVDLIVGAGCVASEFAMYGVPMNERAKRVTETVAALKGAFSGEPFEYRGRTLYLTPKPFRLGGPAVLMGGSSQAAARRAARIADGFVPSVPRVWEFYRDEVQKLGRPDPGPGRGGGAQAIALADAPDKGWEAMAPFFLHETNAYGEWAVQNNAKSPYHVVADTEALRATGQYRVITPGATRGRAKGVPLPGGQLSPAVRGHAHRPGVGQLAPFRRARAPRVSKLIKADTYQLARLVEPLDKDPHLGLPQHWSTE